MANTVAIFFERGQYGYAKSMGPLTHLNLRVLTNARVVDLLRKERRASQVRP